MEPNSFGAITYHYTHSDNVSMGLGATRIDNKPCSVIGKIHGEFFGFVAINKESTISDDNSMGFRPIRYFLFSGTLNSPGDRFC